MVYLVPIFHIFVGDFAVWCYLEQEGFAVLYGEKCMCYGLNICVLQNSYVKALTSCIVVFGRWDIQEVN